MPSFVTGSGNPAGSTDIGAEDSLISAGGVTGLELQEKRADQDVTTGTFAILCQSFRFDASSQVDYC
jgi:hypothetical protein